LRSDFVLWHYSDLHEFALSGDISVHGQDRMDNLLKVSRA